MPRRVPLPAVPESSSIIAPLNRTVVLGVTSIAGTSSAFVVQVLGGQQGSHDPKAPAGR